MTATSSTEDVIVEAARAVFMQKGFAATRMCDIAQTAGINQALLHYYFRTKDKLFSIVFEKESINFRSDVLSILKSDLPFFDKLRLMVRKDIEKFKSAPFLPMFVLNEMHSNPERMLHMASEAQHDLIFQAFSETVKQEYEAGRIRKVRPEQLLLSIMGITMFPYLAEPMIKVSMNLENDDFAKLMEEREDHAIALIENALSV
ncbi:MAG: TetR/AcrR family transcriptional regulator [Saprospiraceae bacterium]|jgi:AcrR family transcriptional regulator